jgi:hypothetical protein
MWNWIVRVVAVVAVLVCCALAWLVSDKERSIQSLKQKEGELTKKAERTKLVEELIAETNELRRRNEEAAAQSTSKPAIGQIFGQEVGRVSAGSEAPPTRPPVEVTKESVSPQQQERQAREDQRHRREAAMELGFPDPETVTQAEIDARQWQTDPDRKYDPADKTSAVIKDYDLYLSLMNKSGSLLTAMTGGPTREEEENLNALVQQMGKHNVLIEGQRRYLVQELHVPFDTKWTRIAEVYLERERIKYAAERGMPLASTWFDIHHHDWAKAKAKKP